MNARLAHMTRPHNAVVKRQVAEEEKEEANSNRPKINRINILQSLNLERR